MKKLLLLALSCFLLIGCNDIKQEDALKKFENLVSKTDNYSIKGTMQILNNEDTYNYDVEVSYRSGDYYKVKLLNTENNHEQIILKNEEGVYVVTPALNKSFKFQSDWPNNSSQTYILETLLMDLKNDEDRNFEIVKDNYIMKSKVNYPNNSNLVSQTITFDKDMKPQKIEVMDDSGVTQISMVITELNLKSKFEKDYFALGSNVDENCCDGSETTGELENVVYPMYLPSGTQYSTEEVIKNVSNERVILTYTGEKPFIIIEEAAKIPNDFEVTSVNGEVVSYGNILGVMTDTSLNWSTNGMEYYIIGSNLSTEELLQIASSTATVAITK